MRTSETGNEKHPVVGIALFLFFLIFLCRLTVFSATVSAPEWSENRTLPEAVVTSVRWTNVEHAAVRIGSVPVFQAAARVDGPPFSFLQKLKNPIFSSGFSALLNVPFLKWKANSRFVFHNAMRILLRMSLPVRAGPPDLIEKN